MARHEGLAARPEFVAIYRLFTTQISDARAENTIIYF